jgi:hypothetical protein
MAVREPSLATFGRRRRFVIATNEFQVPHSPKAS